jgi:TM2 domain-containing membrane protein YozV
MQESEKKIPRERHFLALFFLSFMWGVFGVDRFYMGLIGTGILKLITFGGLGLWALTDFIIIMTGTFSDKQGRVAVQFNEYTQFANKTIFWFSIIVGLIVLLSGIVLIFGFFQFMTAFQDGSIPGLDILQGGGSQQQDALNNLLNQ